MRKVITLKSNLKQQSPFNKPVLLQTYGASDYIMIGSLTDKKDSNHLEDPVVILSLVEDSVCGSHRP